MVTIALQYSCPVQIQLAMMRPENKTYGYGDLKMKRIILLAGFIVCASNLYGQTCAPPNYCADQSTTVKPYPAGPVPTPPTLNNSFLDPVFNRPIWRWTDGSISVEGQRSQGVDWHSGNFANTWNQLSNAFMTGNDQAWSTVLKVNTSNPNAPNVAPWSCTDVTTGLCSGGKIHIPYFPLFANTSNYLVYYMSSDQKLKKADFTANYSSPSTAPTVTSPWFDPFASGKCANAAGLNPSNGGGQPITTSDDAYFWGFGATTGGEMIIWHAGDANCTLLDLQGAGGTWTVSGVGQQGGGTGTITFIDESGNPAANPGTGCTLHGQWYDQITNTVVAQIQSRDCSNYPSIDSFRVSLTTLKGWACADAVHYCGSGHGAGMSLSVAGQGYETSYGTFSANTLKLWAFPLTLPDTVQAWGANPPDITGHNYIVSHSASIWTTSFPLIVANYFQDSNENTSPPQSTLPTTFSIYSAEEIGLWVIPDTTGNNTKYYRFAHTYEADQDYNGGGAYKSAVGPALSPDKCWVAFPSNWYGNLGSTGNRSMACTVSGNCAYDVFAVHLCNAPVNSGTVAAPTGLVVSVN
jgi:hypothetical protein